MWEVRSVGFRTVEVIGRYRWHWVARVHHALANYGLMVSTLDYVPVDSAVPLRAERFPSRRLRSERHAGWKR